MFRNRTPNPEVESAAEAKRARRARKALLDDQERASGQRGVKSVGYKRRTRYEK